MSCRKMGSATEAILGRRSRRTRQLRVAGGSMCRTRLQWQALRVREVAEMSQAERRADGAARYGGTQKQSRPRPSPSAPPMARVEVCGISRLAMAAAKQSATTSCTPCTAAITSHNPESSPPHTARGSLSGVGAGAVVVKPWVGTVERSNRKKAAMQVLMATAVRILRSDSLTRRSEASPTRARWSSLARSAAMMAAPPTCPNQLDAAHPADAAPPEGSPSCISIASWSSPTDTWAVAT
mmetsp:Transcript_33885/g.108076  ORF Transcript_33885/g.108076 Transcript_33885/m.108076 type:complete len:239 (-) Transcript_33885:678-1394(-)